jgi:hypothetical protein
MTFLRKRGVIINLSQTKEQSVKNQIIYLFI